VQSYTTSEASAITGMSVRALRKRVERGQLAAVRRDGRWRIPHAELANAHLLRDESPDVVAIRELTGEVERLVRENAALRLLEERVSSRAEDLERERNAAQAELAAAEAWRSQLTAASWWTRRRLLRDARAS
jgi:hypothetical protein